VSHHAGGPGAVPFLIAAIVCLLGLGTAVVPRLSRANRPAADVDSGVTRST